MVSLSSEDPNGLRTSTTFPYLNSIFSEIATYPPSLTLLDANVMCQQVKQGIGISEGIISQ